MTRKGCSSAASRVSPPNASLARRYAALGYESLVIAAISLLAGFTSARRLGVVSAAAPVLTLPGVAERSLSATLVFALTGLYCVWSWSGGRRTLPMKTWRLILVHGDGAALDAKTAVVRYLAAWIGPLAALSAYAVLRSGGWGAHAVWLVALNFVWAFVDPGRQFLHDRIAGTRLVDEPR